MINNAETLQIQTNHVYHLENVVIGNVRGLQISSTWCSVITKKEVNSGDSFSKINSKNLSDSSMCCPFYQSFVSFKEDGNVKYGEIKGKN